MSRQLSRSTPRKPQAETKLQVPNVDQAKLDPTSVFDRPREVLTARIPTEDKAAILKRWRYDAAEMAVAAEEGMAGGESAQLDAVLRAQRALGETPADKTGQGAKQGLA